MPAVAMPKDDWTPAKLKEHQAWRSRMYAQPALKPQTIVVVEAPTEEEPEPAISERLRNLESLVLRLRAEVVQMRDRASGKEPVDTPVLPLEDIIRVVAKYYDMTPVCLKSAQRTAKFVRPRHVAMYLCKSLTLRSLPEIGRHLGGRDHTTILHGVRKIESKMRTDPELCHEIAELEGLLG